MAWDFSTEPEFQEQLDWMRDFVDNEIAPLSLFFDDMNRQSWREAIRPLQDEVRSRNLWACHLDPELGGQGYGQVKLALMHQILGRVGIAPIVFGNQAPDSGNSELLAIGADEHQKKQWLEPLLRGEFTSCFSMTEPHNAGSDPTMISTTAVRDGDEYVINGHKWFASNASSADFVLAMIVTNPDNPPHAAASMMIIPRGTPGMNIIRDVPTMSHPYPGKFRSGGHAEIKFEDCRIPVANRVGEEGEGFVLAQKRLSGGRIHHAMRWVGQCESAFDMMCERAVSRKVRGAILGEKQMVQDFIAQSSVEIRALKLLALHTAWLLGRTRPVSHTSRDSRAKVLGHKRASRCDRPGYPNPRSPRLDSRSAFSRHVCKRPHHAPGRRSRRSPQVFRGEKAIERLFPSRRLAVRAHPHPPRTAQAKVRPPARTRSAE